MKNNKKVLVIVPAYNEAENIVKTVEDIKKNAKDVDYIVVNDGSKDNTALIAQEYCQKHPTLFRLVQKENGGHGSTINTAIKIAQGKYFRPVDGDDAVQSENVDILIETLKKIESNAVVCDYIIRNMPMENKETRTFPCLAKDSENFFNEANNWQSTFPFHAIIFKTEILTKNNIAMTENCFYEDSEYSLYPIPFCNSVYYNPHPVYIYTLGSDNQSVSFQNVIRHIYDQEAILKKLFAFYSFHENDENNFYYKKRIFEVLNFYYKATMKKEWYKNKELQKRKRHFFNELYLINKNLFLEYVSQTKLRKIQYKTGYYMDRFFLLIYNKLKKQQT